MHRNHRNNRNRRFCLLLALLLSGAAVEIQALAFVRKPYLQKGAPDRATLCWRLDSAVKAEVRFGTAADRLDRKVVQGAADTNACLALEGLLPATKYFYEVHAGAARLASGPDRYFVTHPPAGTRKKFTFWIIGDAGTGNDNQKRVRDAFVKVNGGTHADALIMLGDNAYNNGTELETTNNLFSVYPDIMGNTFTWSTLGNHETYSNGGAAYFSAFDFPTEGESGGVPSKSENFYSFDYGNVHFICLDSEKSSRKATDPMYKWLEADLKAARADWIVAFFHHPPYTWGSHNSDTERSHIEMRQTFMPLLEKHGVDLVYGGHSHVYERSYLLDSAYGSSGHNDSNRTRVVLDGKSGNPEKEGPYRKASADKGNQGAVFTVAGSSGKVSGVKGLHPVMFVQHRMLGSVLLTVDDNVATAKFLDDTGHVKDQFQIVQPKQSVALERSAGPGPEAKAPKFVQQGRRLRFGDVPTPFRVYSPDGQLLHQAEVSGEVDLDARLLPAGEYFFRYGSGFGNLVLP